MHPHRPAPRPSPRLSTTAALLASLALPAAAQADPPAPAAAPAAAASTGPTIDLAPPDDPRPLIPRTPGLQLPRESAIEVAIDRPATDTPTGIGAYGEIHLTSPRNGDPTEVDVRRMVLFLGHSFTDRLRIYTELEVEHAIVSSDDSGEFEVEQLILDYLQNRWLNFRLGLVLMPVGIVNQYHEPPTFNGVLRPETDTRIIPSTWREVGGGVFGGAGPFRWQLYGVTSFKARDFDAEGIREGHQEGQLARARDWGVVGRVDYVPLPGFDIGLSGYYADAGQGDAALGGARAGLGLVEVDARFRWKGIEARGEFVNLWVNDTARINTARMADWMADPDKAGLPFEPVAHQLRGGYLEVGYNVLQQLHLRLGSQLVAFVRYERTDTQAEVNGFVRALGKDRQILTGGLNFRPVAELAIKLDYQHITSDINSDGSDQSWGQINAGMAFMF